MEATENVTGGAYISQCTRYRYSLWRDLPPGDGTVCFIMLNPSTATAWEDDPTIRRCIGFARRWGYARLMVVNLFAYRSTDPAALKTAWEPVGPENDEQIVEAVSSADLTVCAWGQHGRLFGREAKVRELLAGYELTALRRAKNGSPCHPLYLPGALNPEPWPAKPVMEIARAS